MPRQSRLQQKEDKMICGNGDYTQVDNDIPWWHPESRWHRSQLVASQQKKMMVMSTFLWFSGIKASHIPQINLPNRRILHPSAIKAAESMDLVLDMIPAGHALEPYVPLLKLDGALVMVGVVTEPLQFASPLLMIAKRSITGSFTRSMEEARELLQDCGNKGVSCMIKKINIDYVNTAMERLEENDVRCRFVIDVAGRNLEKAV